MILPCFFITCLALCVNGLKLHEEMTSDEIRYTFNVPHDKVDSTEYEVTRLHHIQHPDSKGQRIRRARSIVQFNAFDESVSLDLLENDNTLLGSTTPLYRAYRGRDGSIQYSRQQFPMPSNMKLYHDRKKRAAIVTFTDEYNKTHVSGTVGDYVIKPIPDRLRKLDDPALHLVIKTDPQANKVIPVDVQQPYNPNSNYQPTWQQGSHSRVPITQDQSWQGVQNSQRSAIHQTADAQYSGIVYPKILVTVDYEMFEKHGSNINELSKYMAAFWNSVDLIFRELRQPQIRLNIAGLVVPETRDSAPYFDKGFVNYGTLDGDVILTEMQKTFTNERQLDRSTYDIAIAITSRHLNFYKQEEGKTITIAGLANRGLACTEYGLALVQDLRHFYGVAIAAHELGHSFNATHDGNESYYSQGGPCPVSDGYIMNPKTAQGKNALHWSRCSRAAISEFFMSSQAQCTRKKPDIGTPYPKILPGKIYSRNDQCKKHAGDNFVSVGSETDCERLWCKNPSSSESTPTTPAEGTPCGEGRICLLNQCVRDPIVQNMPVGSPYDPPTIPQKPNAGTQYPTNLPGYVPSRDEQCATFLGNNFISVKGTENDCEILRCQNRYSPKDNFSGIKSLVEGSSCGPQSICLSKRCVRDPRL